MELPEKPTEEAEPRGEVPSRDLSAREFSGKW